MTAPQAQATSIPRFIVGMSRAGTTWLSKCLNEHPEAAVFGETAFFGRGYVEPNSHGLYDSHHLQRVRGWLGDCRWIRQMTTPGPGALKHITLESLPRMMDAVFAEVQPPIAPADLFQRICRAVASAEGKSIVIEKTPHHVNWIDRILAAMPMARFVIMLRDPYSFMLSYKHQGDRKANEVRKRFAMRYHPFGCAIVWRGSMRAASAAVAGQPRHALLVRFEDIATHPWDELNRVLEFLQFKPAELAGRVPADNTSFPEGDRPALRGDDLFWMNLLARREIRQYGTRLQRSPREPLRVIWSIIVLPFWAIRNLLDLRKIIAGPMWRYLWRWIAPADGRGLPE